MYKEPCTNLEQGSEILFFLLLYFEDYKYAQVKKICKIPILHHKK